MNVASLELCKTLFELSSWDDTDFDYDEDSKLLLNNLKTYGLNGRSDGFVRNKMFKCTPAYDLGYLLRKLPEGTRLSRNLANPRKRSNYKGEWSIGVYCSAEYGRSAIAKGQQAGTPEGCAATLAIELFKQGILTKETTT